MPLAKIAPSMLSSDFALLKEEAHRMKEYGAQYLHMDVMDGHFVPNLTLGAPIIKSLRQYTKLYIDCHLMVSDPEQWVSDFAEAGANGYTFHIEATQNPKELIRIIKASGMRAGVAIKPGTLVESIFDLCKLVDMVLIMTVEPGFGGQKMIPEMLSKVKILRNMFPDLDIQVDGGIGIENIDLVAQSGANVIVSGTGIFGNPDPKTVIETMSQAVKFIQSH